MPLRGEAHDVGAETQQVVELCAVVVGVVARDGDREAVFGDAGGVGAAQALRDGCGEEKRTFGEVFLFGGVGCGSISVCGGVD